MPGLTAVALMRYGGQEAPAHESRHGKRRLAAGPPLPGYGQSLRFAAPVPEATIVDSMHAGLAAVAADFESATSRLDALERVLSNEQWTRRPAEHGWSAIECIQHLNLTARATLPRVKEGIAEARRTGAAAPVRYRRDFWGWLLWRGLRQPGRFKTKTAPAFVPDSHRPASEIIAAFRQLQVEHVACVRDSDGLAVDRVRIVSPFNERVRYSVYSALTILAVHQHRHFWQAERAAAIA
jgi:hypothetical protein